jgi:hypothetical protein
MEHVNPAGAHHPDEPYVGGVLKTGNTAQVSPSIAAPVADDAEHLWLKTAFCSHSSPLKKFKVVNSSRYTPIIYRI